MLYNMKHTFVNVLLINDSKTKHKKGKKINKQIIASTTNWKKYVLVKIYTVMTLYNHLLCFHKTNSDSEDKIRIY